MIHKYVQYGCGWDAPETWTNFNISPTLRFERLPVIGRLYTRNEKRFPKNVRYGDIVRGLPIPANFCLGMYCSHVLEHLALDDFDAALRNTYAHLAPGGVFRFVLPDLENLARSYLEDSSDDAAIRFMDDMGVGVRHRARGLGGLARYVAGNSAHLWLWDERSMRKKLAEHGFKGIRRAQFGDDEDLRFNEVESLSRFEGCLGMRCVK
jgi:SAM-dependent methyltransferase